MQEYSSVFKKDLGPEDRLNYMVPIETPRHLQSATKEGLGRLIKSECLEPERYPTSNSFFVQKNTTDGTTKARLVTDLCKVNPNLKRIGTHLDGSSHILKMMSSLAQ